MKKDIISVAMATFNGGKFLREQLNSLYSQTMLPDEIIVTDDNSTDDTHLILQEFKSKHGLSFVINEHRLGVNANFEKSIRRCSGDYIIICDQDDIWFPDKIKKTYEKIKEIENNRPALVSSQCYHMDETGSFYTKKTNISNDTFGYADTLLNPPGVTQGCSLMFNRHLLNLLKPFPDTDLCMYDGYIGFIAASIGVKYNMCTPLMYYRHHNCNYSASKFIYNNKLYHDIVSRINNFISPTHIPPRRFEVLHLLEREYGSFFSKEVKDLYHNLCGFASAKSKREKISYICKIDELPFWGKIGWVIGVLFHRR